MAWTASSIFREWPNMVFQASGTGYTGLDSDTVKGSLFGGNTPSKDAVAASTGFNTGVWLLASEKTGGGSSDWVTSGRALASKTFTTPSSGVVVFDAADLTSVATSTLSGVEGIFIYDDTISGGTVADQGICFNWFGGSQSVTAGTFSVVWNVSGIFQIEV